MGFVKKYEIKKSKIAGQGVFAKEDLKKSINLGIAFKKKKDTGIPDKDYQRTRLGEKTNHFSKPNAKLIKKGVYFYIQTSKKIKQGEEITIDYGTIPWAGKRVFHSSSKSTPVS